MNEFSGNGVLNECTEMSEDQLIDLMLEADKEYDEKLEKSPLYAPRGFTFFSSNREAYYWLKSINPELAVQYFESLIDYGCARIPIKGNGLIKHLLAGTTQAIDKAYREYKRRVELTESEHRKELMDNYIKEQRKQRK
jgi:hypothetical protein